MKICLIKKISLFVLSISIFLTLGSVSAAPEECEVAFNITSTSTELFLSPGAYSTPVWSDGVSAEGNKYTVWRIVSSDNMNYQKNYIFNQDPRYNTYIFDNKNTVQAGGEYASRFLFDRDVYNEDLKSNPYSTLDFSNLFYATASSTIDGCSDMNKYIIYALYEDEDGNILRYGDGVKAIDYVKKKATDVGKTMPDGSGDYTIIDYTGVMEKRIWYEVSIPLVDMNIDYEKGLKGIEISMALANSYTGTNSVAYYNIRISTPSVSNSQNIVPFTTNKYINNTSVKDNNISWECTNGTPLFYSVYDMEGNLIINTTEGSINEKNKLVKVYPYFDEYGYAEGSVVGNFFLANDVNDVTIKSIFIDDSDAPYSDYKLSSGQLSFKVTACTTENKKLKLCVVRYKDGYYVGGSMSESKNFEKNESDFLNTSITVDDENEIIKLLLLDEENNISSNSYQISQSGVEEIELVKNSLSLSQINAFYNPITSTVDFELNANNNDLIFVTVKIEGNDDINDYIYIGCCEYNADSKFIQIPIDTSKHEERNEKLIVNVTGFDNMCKAEDSCDYLSPKVIKGYCDIINAPGSTEAQIEGIVKLPALRFDLTDYNLLIGVDGAQNKVASLIKGYNIMGDVSSCGDIEQLLIKACGTVMLSCKPSVDAIEKYKDMVGLNLRYLNIYNQFADNEKNDTASLMTVNAVDAEEASNDVAVRIFNNAVITADVKASDSFGELMQKIRETYSDEINIDESIADGKSISDVYKYIFNNRLSLRNINDIKAKFVDGVNSVSTGETKSSSKKGGSGFSYYSTTTNTTQQPDTAVEVRTSFFDLPDDHWALASVNRLNEIGIISNSDTFRPNDSVTREEIVKMLVCAFGQLDVSAKCDFKDVIKESWYYSYVASANISGIAQGMGNGNFGIGEFVTRQDAAVMIYRCAGDFLNDVSDVYLVEFDDKASISDYAEEAVKNLTYNKIINGYEDNTFRPEGMITRAECASLIAALIRR